MIHRHLEYPAAADPEQWPTAALADVLDRGDLDDWKPLLVAIGREPYGTVAEKVSRLIDAFPMYGTSPLWRAYLERCRARYAGAFELTESNSLTDLRRRLSVTQTALAARLQISQSDLSKLERRRDWRLSTLRRYVSALGGRLRLTVDFRAEERLIADGALRPGNRRMKEVVESEPVSLDIDLKAAIDDERANRM
ncbi:MAG: hypothetical protein WD651_13535 [Acidimicrobiia bacterium]